MNSSTVIRCAGAAVSFTARISFPSSLSALGLHLELHAGIELIQSHSRLKHTAAEGAQTDYVRDMPAALLAMPALNPLSIAGHQPDLLDRSQLLVLVQL